MLLRKTSEVVAQYVGPLNVSRQHRIVQKLIIITQYINTGLILSLVNANFDQVGFGVTVLNGDYPDFTERWYHELAPLFL